MLGWLRERPARARLLAERIEEGMRELGVLFLAFAPLDAVLSGRPLVQVGALDVSPARHSLQRSGAVVRVEAWR